MRRIAHILILAVVLAIPVHAFAGTAAVRSVQTYTQLFDSREIPSTNLKPFPKWQGVLDRYFDERELEDAPCTSTTFNRCHLREWKAFLAGIEGKDRMTQLQEVNRFMNEAIYIIDPINYHVPDYWATPVQFFNKDGDCEDYAIAKFMSLRALGYDNGDLRIVVLQDLNLRLAHAVLVTYVDGVPYVLDNQIPQAVPAAIIRHYRPFYSINEDTWWLHRPR
ncbi:MAG: transglutaminase-like cysteine peptidase [Alphaproteobacteria bacterium]